MADAVQQPKLSKTAIARRMINWLPPKIGPVTLSRPFAGMIAALHATSPSDPSLGYTWSVSKKGSGIGDAFLAYDHTRLPLEEARAAAEAALQRLAREGAAHQPEVLRWSSCRIPEQPDSANYTYFFNNLMGCVVARRPDERHAWPDGSAETGYAWSVTRRSATITTAHDVLAACDLTLQTYDNAMAACEAAMIRLAECGGSTRLH